MLPEARGTDDYREPPQADAPGVKAAGEAGEVFDGVSRDASETRRAPVDAALHGQRLDKALVRLAPEFSRAYLQAQIDAGRVRVDGAVARVASRRVRAGQSIEIDLVPTEESQAFRPQPMALSIVHEDTHLLVLDKPAGVVVHPAPGNWSGTLLNGLLAHHAAAASLPRAGIVHRLDKNTSGLMLVGKSLQAVTALTRDIAARAVHRRYVAISHGDAGRAPFTVDAPIGRDPQVRVRMAVVAGGRPSRTDVEVVAVREGCSALVCTLHTGRTHQIRVHLAWRGLPLVADTLYGGRPALDLARVALHATALRLLHPVTREALFFERAPPDDFAAAWERVAVGAD